MLNVIMVKSRVFRGDRLKQIRDKHGLTQDELAERVDVGLAQINRYERGKTQPDPNITVKLALELGVTTDWLYGLSDAPHGILSEADLSPENQAVLQAFREGNIEELMRIALESKNPKVDD